MAQTQRKPHKSSKSKRRSKREPRKTAKPISSLLRPDIVPTVSQTIEQVLIQGDLTPLKPEERVGYYKAVCKSLGLNPLTSPFGYILFKESETAPAKLALYAKKDAAEQLRKIHRVSVIPKTTTQEVTEDFATTRLSLMDRTGRTDTATGIVYLWKKYNGQPYRLTGQRLGDAIMKSETKAKRRGTLSICGLGILDEMDLESVRVVGGVTPDGRIYQFEPPAEPGDVPPERQLSETAPHGHPEGSERAKQAEAALRRVEEADKALESPQTPSKNVQAQPHQPQKKASKAKPEPPAEPNTEVPKASPVPPMEFKGTIEIDCTVPFPIVRGDLANIVEPLQKAFASFQWGIDSWWHVAPGDVATLTDALAANGYKVDCKWPPKDSAGKKASAMTPTPPAEAAGSGAGSGRDQSAAAATLTVTGTLERSQAGMANKSPVRDITLLLADRTKPSYRCWNKNFFEALDAGLGKVAVIELKKNKSYWNVEAVKSIGGKEYDENGKVVIQQRDREAGGKTLF
jgi:hypothetical protein